MELWNPVPPTVGVEDPHSHCDSGRCGHMDQEEETEVGMELLRYGAGPPIANALWGKPRAIL